MKQSLIKRGKSLLFDKSPSPVSLQEIVLSSLAALVAIALVYWISSWYIGADDLPIIMASMGAAAVLLFAVPHSPFSQPWPFVGGHLVATTVGVSCAQLIPDTLLASAIAVAMAIFLMHLLRCLHPPGGAAALMAVVGGDDIQALSYNLVLTPVALNIVVMLGCVLLINRLILGRRYPGTQSTAEEDLIVDMAGDDLDFTNSDLNSALREMNTYIDVSHEDLNRIYALANLQARKRRLGKIPCRDIMTRDVISIEYGHELEEVWGLMQRHAIKSLPVIDPARRVIGIVTVTDFIKEAAEFEGDSIQQRLRRLIRRTPGFNSKKPEVAGQIMTTNVITVTESADAVSVIPLFSRKGIHHIPVIDTERRLCGMVTRHDLMRVLSQQ